MTRSRLRIEPERREVSIDGTPVRLGARAFDVLVALAQRHGQFISKGELLDLAWPGLVVEENNLEVQVSGLRRLLGRDAIVTVPGRGYSLVLSPAVESTRGPGATAWSFEWASSASRPNNLPVALTSFIGRENDLSSLTELARKSRLLTLTGTGGCGKTRLSIELAAALLPGFADGAWLVELAALTDSTLLPQTVQKALGLRDAPGKSALEVLTAHLATRKALLVLDNAEHLLAACAQLVDAILSRCGNVSIVVSSRALLGITGEITYRVPSLALPDQRQSSTPPLIEQCDAVRLFVERVQLHQPAFAVDAGNAADIVRICRRLDGIPLAIELAAARLRTLSIQDVARRVEGSFDLLDGGSRTALPRHQTLHALIDWSHDLLDASERTLFERLAVFSRGFTVEAAEAVCHGDGLEASTVLPLLTALADQSLLTAEPVAGDSRLRMLETVWAYASDRLRQSGDLARRRARHLAYFVDWTAGAEAGLKGADQGQWLNRLEADHDNLRAALQTSLSDPEHLAAGLQLAGVLWRFWSNRGHAAEGRMWLQRLLAVDGSDVPGVILAKALHGAGVMAHVQCDYAAADAFHQRALDIRRAQADDEGVADSLHCLSSSAMMQGDYDRAQASATDCLALRRRLGNPRSLAGSLNNVAGLAAMRGDLATAEPLYLEAVRLHQAAGNHHGVALGLVNLGVIAGTLGDLVLSAQRHEEALNIHRALEDGRAVAMDLVHLGKVSLERGAIQDAQRCYGECLSLAGEQGDPLCAVELLQGVARLALTLGDAATAASLYASAELAREHIGAPIEAGDQADHAMRIAAVREALGDERAFARAWQQGRMRTLDQALQDARRFC